MNRLAIAAVAIAAPLLAACATHTPVADARRVERADAHCLRETGTLLKRADDSCLPLPGRTIERTDLELTGVQTLGEAIERVLP